MKEVSQALTSGRATQFPKSFGFDLTNAFAGDIKMSADFFKCVIFAIIEAIAHFKDFSFTRGEDVESRMELFFEN